MGQASFGGSSSGSGSSSTSGSGGSGGSSGVGVSYPSQNPADYGAGSPWAASSAQNEKGWTGNDVTWSLVDAKSYVPSPIRQDVVDPSNFRQYESSSEVDSPVMIPLKIPMSPVYNDNGTITYTDGPTCGPGGCGEKIPPVPPLNNPPAAKPGALKTVRQFYDESSSEMKMIDEYGNNTDLGSSFYNFGIVPAGGRSSSNFTSGRSDKYVLPMGELNIQGVQSQAFERYGSYLRDPANQKEWLGSAYVEGDKSGNLEKVQSQRYALERNDSAWAWNNRETGYGPLSVVNPPAGVIVNWGALNSYKSGNSQQVSADLRAALNDAQVNGFNNVITGFSKNNPYYTQWTSIDPQTGKEQMSTSGEAYLKAGISETHSPFTQGVNGPQYWNENMKVGYDKGNLIETPASLTSRKMESPWTNISSAVDYKNPSDRPLPSELSGSGVTGTHEFLENKPSGKTPPWAVPITVPTSSPSTNKGPKFDSRNNTQPVFSFPTPTSSNQSTNKIPSNVENPFAFTPIQSAAIATSMTFPPAAAFMAVGSVYQNIKQGKKMGYNASSNQSTNKIPSNVENPFAFTPIQSAAIATSMTFPPAAAFMAVGSVYQNIKQGKKMGYNAFEGSPILNAYEGITGSTPAPKPTSKSKIMNPITGKYVDNIVLGQASTKKGNFKV
jgi:hypothetical protein